MNSDNITESHEVASFIHRLEENPSSFSLICLRCGEEGHSIRRCPEPPITFSFSQSANDTMYDEPKEDVTMIDVSPSPMSTFTASEDLHIYKVMSKAECASVSQDQAIPGLKSNQLSPEATRFNRQFIPNDSKPQMPVIPRPFKALPGISSPSTHTAPTAEVVDLAPKKLERRLRIAEKRGVDPEDVSDTCPYCGRGSFKHERTCIARDRHQKKKRKISNANTEIQHLVAGKKMTENTASPLPLPTSIQRSSIVKPENDICWECPGCSLSGGEHTLPCSWLKKQVEKRRKVCHMCGVLVGHEDGCARALLFKSKGRRMGSHSGSWTILKHHFKGWKAQSGKSLKNLLRMYEANQNGDVSTNANASAKSQTEAGGKQRGGGKVLRSGDSQGMLQQLSIGKKTGEMEESAGDAGGMIAESKSEEKNKAKKKKKKDKKKGGKQ